MSIIDRIVDIRNSISLVQYDNKLLKYVQTSALSQVLIDKYLKEIKEESQVEGGKYKNASS